MGNTALASLPGPAHKSEAGEAGRGKEGPGKSYKSRTEPGNNQNQQSGEDQTVLEGLLMGHQDQ